MIGHLGQNTKRYEKNAMPELLCCVIDGREV